MNERAPGGEANAGGPRAETCERVEALFTASLAEEISAADRFEIEQHLAACPRCAVACAEVDRVWSALGELPLEPPAPAVRQRFDSWLEREVEKEQAQEGALRSAGRRTRDTTVRPFVARSRAATWARSLALPVAAALALGIGLGYAVRGRGGDGDSRAAEPRTDVSVSADLTALREEVGALNRLVALSLLERPAATDRLLGVSRGREVAAADTVVVEALIAAVRQDRNVNVRLAAIDALAPLLDRAAVRDGLLAAAADSDSPLVQAAVAQRLLQARPQESKASLRRWLDERGEAVDPSVRDWVTRHLGAAA